MREKAPLDGDLVDSPALRIWINLPALLLIAAILVGLKMLLSDLSGNRRTMSVGLLVSILLGMGLSRTFAFVIGDWPAPDPPSQALTIPADGREAAQWLRTASYPSERVITNAHCGPVRSKPDRCDSRHFWMTALTQRRFVIEGWAYTPRSGDWKEAYWGETRFLESNDRLFTKPTNDLFANFLRQHPADWMLVDGYFPADTAELDRFRGVDLA
jgi:hypothetical protein